ncbi:MAG: DUF6508 domain-containing protein [Ilumatobacteraceae bacterium]
MKQETKAQLLTDRWGKLRYAAAEAEQAVLLSEFLPSDGGAFFRFRMAVGTAGLVKPFDWMTWGDPQLTVELAAQLTAEEVWKHATRIVRGDRFCEGLFESHVRDLSLMALARRAYELSETEDGWPRSFSELDDADLETGLVVESRLLDRVGVTTGFREQRTNSAQPGWDFQVMWDDETCTMEDMNEWHLVLPLKTLVQLPDHRAAEPRR